MDKHKIMCEFLIEADGYFNDKNVDTEEINKHLTIKGYCYNDDCKTNEDSINALTTYIFKEFKKSIKNDKYNEYDECFLMWLSDKLFKIHIESKGKKNVKNYMDGTTLNQAYENYLKSYKVKLGYWDFFDNIKGLKEANLKYMIEFYKLLNNICKTITDYETNGAESRKLSKYSKNCLNQYRILYNNISECKSYVRLLNKLKGIYDDFRNYAIKETSSNNNLATKLQKLTREDGVEMNAVRSFKPYKFIKKKCNSLDKKNAKPKKTDPPGLPPSSKKESLPPKAPLKQDTSEPAPPSPQEPQPETQQSSSTTSPEDPPAKLELPSSSQESQELGKNNQNPLTDSGKETGGSKSEIKGPEVGDEKKNGGDKEPGTPSGEDGSQVNEGDRANSESSGADTEKDGPEGGSTDKFSETGDPGNGKDPSKGGGGDVSGGNQGSQEGSGDSGNLQGSSNDRTKDSGGGTGSGTSSGAINGTDTGAEGTGGITGDGKVGSNDGMCDRANTGSQVGADGEPGGTCDLQDNHGSQEGSSGDKVSQDGSVGDKGSQDGQDDQKSPDGSGDSETGPGSEQNPTDSAPREKETQNASWPLFDIRSYIYTIASKGMEQLHNAFEFYEEKKEQLTKVTDTMKNLYNTSVSNMQNSFNNFTEFFNNFINNLSIDSKQVEDPPDSGDKQSGSDGTGDNPSTPNAPSESPKDSGDNESGSNGEGGDPPTHTGPSQSQKDSPQQDQHKQDSHKTPSDTSQTSQGSQPPPTPQTTQTTENSKEQTQVQKSPQGTSENQNSDQTDHEEPQKPVSAPVTKQENPGTELKGNGITEIGDSYVLKEYKQFVISIIVILIPITLTILYKYLSFGRRNELKKKKNMKKAINMVVANKTTKTVINSSDGKKQIQIIIKSSSQKKQIKKSIKPIYR
ncbi:Plasmodium variant antigen protein Cir/Yir/Bir, putative, partial [Plasmodium chabaudi adami]